MSLPPLLRVIAELGADAALPIPLPPHGEVDVLHPKGLAYLLETGTLGDSPVLVAGATMVQWAAVARSVWTIVTLVARRWRCGAVWSAGTPFPRSTRSCVRVVAAEVGRVDQLPSGGRAGGAGTQRSGPWCPLPRVTVGGCRMDVERA